MSGGTFAYRAVDEAGCLHRGRLAAATLEELESRLKTLGLDLITGRPVRRSRLFSRKGAGRRELINFCFQLEQLTAAGVPLLQALADVRATAEGEFGVVTAAIGDRIMEGKSFSGALAEFPESFDPVFVNLVRAGESSGQLPAILGELAATLKWQDEWAARIRKLALYPAFVAIVVIAAMAFLMVYLVPQLVRFLTSMGGELPSHTRALLWVSDLFANHWLALACIPVVALVGLHAALRRDPRLRLWLDGFRLRLWITGDLRSSLILSRFARVFSLMYRSGMPVLEILQVTGGVMGNRALDAAFDAVREEIAHGATIARAFESSALFPPLVLRMIHMGETTGALDRAMGNVGYFFDRDVQERMGRLEAMIEPAMTLMLGALLGWIMLAVLGPVYDLVTRIAP